MSSSEHASQEKIESKGKIKTPSVSQSNSKGKVQSRVLSGILSFLKKGEPVTPIVRRRRTVIALILGFLGTNFFMFLRFFFPRTLFEPKTIFRIGYPSDFGYGVDTKFQKAHRIWVVRDAEGLSLIHI